MAPSPAKLRRRRNLALAATLILLVLSALTHAEAGPGLEDAFKNSGSALLGLGAVLAGLVALGCEIARARGQRIPGKPLLTRLHWVWISAMALWFLSIPAVMASQALGDVVGWLFSLTLGVAVVGSCVVVYRARREPGS